MKKIIRFFLNYILISTTILNVSACRWGCTNNDYDLDDERQQDISCDYIVSDLDKRTNKIISDRLDYNYERDGKDISSLKKWYFHSPKNNFHKTSKKIKFIENLEEKIQYKAKQESITEFNNLANNKTIFQNFNDLQNQLNNYNLGKTKVNINWNNFINDLIKDDLIKNKIKEKLLCFYNIFAQVYGKENILKLLYRMAKINQNEPLGFAISRKYCNGNSCAWIQVMGLSPIVFNQYIQKQQYNVGNKASKSIIRTIVHEYGHFLGKFICLNLQEKQNINSLADNNPNAWWNNYFNSSYLLKNNLEKIKINDETNYMISSLSSSTKINNPIYQKLLAYGIVRSNYGRDSHPDLFAEAFDQWIDTEENQRNIAWEKLDNFFRIDLPKIL